MPFSNDRKLDGITEQSREHIARAHDSCLDGAAHVRSSRAAIQRSLELLGRSFFRLSE
jgi:hypothetical protein